MINKALKFLALFVSMYALTMIVVPGARAATTTAPLPAIITSAPPVVNIPVTLTTDADCNTSRCQWSWDYFNQYGQVKTGGQIGEGQSTTYTFSTYAASKSFVVIKVKVTSPGPTNNYMLGTLVTHIATSQTTAPTSYGVGSPCQFTWYGAPAYKVFIACGVGSHAAFYAYVNCGVGYSGTGPWQTHVGPWNGSMAVCPAGHYAVSATAIFSA